MPAARTYPGVYVEEIPSAVRTITGVSTSITAFIGRALRGPVNQPVTVYNYGDFERTFGGLWLQSTLGFAVRDFFQNGGSQAVIVRLFHPYFPTSADRTQALSYSAAIITALNAITTPFTPDVATAVAAAMAPTVTAAATADASVVGAVAQIVAAANQAATATPAPTTIAPIVAAATTASLAAIPLIKSRYKINTVDGVSPGSDVLLDAKYEGSYTNGLRIVVAKVDADVAQKVADRYGLTKDDWFNVTFLDDVSGDVLEKFVNVSIQNSERRFDKILENESEYLRAAEPWSFTVTTRFNTANSPYRAGANDKALDGETLDGTDVKGSESAKRGIYALENVDLFNLLCIPPLSGGSGLGTALIDEVVKYCKKRRAVLLIDAPWSSVTAALANVDTDIGAPAANAAVFFPRLRQPNPLRDNQIEDFAPCGAVAGVIARTDAARGVWKAPAGLDAALNGVPQLSININDQESGQLNQRGINALRAMPAAGRVIWGSRTRLGSDGRASEWKYLSIRRLALYLEESLYRGTQWVVFQKNDEPLWAQIRLNVGAFMQDLFRQGAFQGQTPREAYFVKCDSSTTTQSDINQGVVNVIVGFAPLKPAEFVVIKLQQMAGQSTA